MIFKINFKTYQVTVDSPYIRLLEVGYKSCLYKCGSHELYMYVYIVMYMYCVHV